MKTVFFDVDTQIDFLFPAGALSVPGAESIIGALGALTKYAAVKGLQIISTADAHSEDDPEFKIWKPHCVVGTTGQRKAAATLLERSGPAQIIIEKQHLDCFTNLNLRPLLNRLQPDRYVLYGVVSEVCVQYAAFGLLETGAKVDLVTDAIKSLNSAAEEKMIAEFKDRGGTLTTVSTVTA